MTDPVQTRDYFYDAATGQVLAAVDAASEETLAGFAAQGLSHLVAPASEIALGLAHVDGSGAIVAADAPPPPPPARITSLQAHLALIQANLYDAVEAAIGQADKATQVFFSLAPEWLRSDPRINAIGANLGLTSAQIDALFVAAAAL